MDVTARVRTPYCAVDAMRSEALSERPMWRRNPAVGPARRLPHSFGDLIAADAMAEQRETDFWAGFERNEDVLFGFERDRERIFDALAAELKKVHPDLTFEFSPIQEDGWREFVISAGGFRDAFPSVERLFACAPRLVRWKFVKFRPRREPMPLTFADRCVDPEDVHFQLFRDGNKIGIILFFEDYREEARNFFGHVGFLMLDQALGEFTVGTEVGFIEFTDRDSEFFDERLVLADLARAFDDALTERSL
jgi:hypothetical protein